MRVKVKVFASLREKLGTGEVEVEVDEYATLSRLLCRLAELWPKVFEGVVVEGGLSEGYNVLLNGVTVDVDAKLRDGDVVAILPPVGGGCFKVVGVSVDY